MDSSIEIGSAFRMFQGVCELIIQVLLGSASPKELSEELDLIKSRARFLPRSFTRLLASIRLASPEYSQFEPRKHLEMQSSR